MLFVFQTNNSSLVIAQLDLQIAPDHGWGSKNLENMYSWIGNAIVPLFYNKLNAVANQSYTCRFLAWHLALIG